MTLAAVTAAVPTTVPASADLDRTAARYGPAGAGARGTRTRQATYTTTLASPVGMLTLVAREGELVGLRMHDQRHAPAIDPAWVRDDAPFADVAEQLLAYFAGERAHFDVPVRLEGTPFQVEVWSALCEIPFGETVSYAALARLVGRTGAARAVGQANGRNPVAIVVPCHRVVAADGTIGGYGGGLDRKRWLLGHEGAVGAWSPAR